MTFRKARNGKSEDFEHENRERERESQEAEGENFLFEHGWW